MPRRKKSSFTHEDVKAPEDLDRLDKEGLIAFLRSERDDKVKLWNAWRESHVGESLDLEGAILTATQLEGIHFDIVKLEGAHFGQAHLERATFIGAQLERGYFAEARLDEAIFLSANLERAGFYAARLERAIFSHSRLQRAAFPMAYLERANLAGAHLEEAELCWAHLEGADLSNAHLDGADLRWAHLEGADLGNAYLDGADLGFTNLQGADLNRAHVKSANLESTILKWSVLSVAGFKGANLRSVQLEGAAVDNANFEQADLRLAHLRGTALSSLAPGGLRRVKLYQTYFWGVLSLRYEQFLEDESDANSRSTIWEDTECRYSEAKDIYKTLKGYFEDAGDYEGANWAYRNEQEMEKFVYTPTWAQWLYHPRKWQSEGYGVAFAQPNTVEWLRLEIFDKLAGYGLSLTKPLFWLAFVILTFALIYWAFGMITDIPGCQYPNPRTPGCHPGDFLDALLFSVSAMTTVDSGTVQPYLSNVSLTASVEALLGIALTGLFGFVLGNKLRNS